MSSDFEILLKGQFSGMASGWNESLCLDADDDGIWLSSRGFEVLTDASQFAVLDEDGDFVEYRVPEFINGIEVEGIEGEWVVGGNFVPHDDDAEIHLSFGQTDEALEWLKRREWHLQPGFDEAWWKIQKALKGPRGRR